MRKKWIFFAPLAILAMAGFIALGGYVVMRLWNWLTPVLFGWHHVTFWEGLGLLLLCRILFGGLGVRGGPRSHFRRQMGERWDHMNPEEREKWRQRFLERFGPFAAPGSEKKEPA